MPIHHNGGPFHTVSLSSAALSTANSWDLVNIVAGVGSRFEVTEIRLGLASTAFPVNAALTLSVLRGSTGLSTAASITPRPVAGWAGASTASFSATAVSSTPVSTSSAALILSLPFNADGVVLYRPASRDERIV